MMIRYVFYLITKRKTNMFVLYHLLNTVQQKEIILNLKYLTCDCELIAISAFNNIFPTIRVSRCLFHSSQSFWLDSILESLALFKIYTLLSFKCTYSSTSEQGCSIVVIGNSNYTMFSGKNLGRDYG